MNTVGRARSTSRLPRPVPVRLTPTSWSGAWTCSTGCKRRPRTRPGTLTSNGNGTPLSDAQVGQINALISHGDAMLAGTEAVTPTYSTAEVSAAVQIAIWSTELGADYSFHADDNRLNGSGGLVSQYLANVVGARPTWSATPFSNVLTVSSPGSQTLARLDVPEPASAALLGAGVAGIALLRRQRAFQG